MTPSSSAKSEPSDTEEEGAMSWKRAFRHMYRKFCWQTAFVQSNKAAITHLINEIYTRLLVRGEKSVLVQKFRSFAKNQDLFIIRHETSDFI
jgi:hypothetical protein